MIDCVRKTWSREGWRGFTGGLGPTLIRYVDSPLESKRKEGVNADGRSPFANGATFVAFEMAMRAMA
jgi:solute carrier family 25 carnitine/acylcarnitine transporter 20/29